MSIPQCKIIDNEWKCRINYLKYVDFKYRKSSHTKWAYSTVKFDLKEKKLKIPYFYHTILVIIGYRYIRYKCGESTCLRKKYKIRIKFNWSIYRFI